MLCFILVKEAVQKAELDASLAAQDAVRHGHKAEARVENAKTTETSDGSNDHNVDDKPKAVSKHETSGTELILIGISSVRFLQ